MCVISGRRPCSRPRTEVRVLRGPFALVRQCKCGVRSKGGHTAAPRSTSASLRMRSCASRSTPLKSAALMPIEPRKPSVCSTNSRLSAPISEKRAKKVSHLGHTPRAIDVSWTWHGRARARAEGGVPPLLHRLERVEEGELAEWIVSAVALAHLDQRRVVAAELLVPRRDGSHSEKTNAGSRPRKTCPALRPHHLALKGRLLPAEGRRRHRLISGDLAQPRVIATLKGVASTACALVSCDIIFAYGVPGRSRVISADLGPSRARAASCLPAPTPPAGRAS